jgi:hypothetical protein
MCNFENLLDNLINSIVCYIFMAIEGSFKNDCRNQRNNPLYVPQAVMDGRCSPEYGTKVVNYVEEGLRRRVGRFLLSSMDALLG